MRGSLTSSPWLDCRADDSRLPDPEALPLSADPLATDAQARAQAWSLVLASQGIPHAVQRSGELYRIAVPAEHAERASAAIGAYNAENPPKPPPVKTASFGATQAGFVVAALLLLFHALAVRDAGAAWPRAGVADASRILAGEWWRVVTALTLHADLAHVLANAASCAVFVTILCRWIGPGHGLGLSLLAGALGNAANAFFEGPWHLSVGASTGLFGAIGVLAGLSFRQRTRVRARRGRAWVAFAGGLGLVAMLGTGGERTDVSAHLFGFGAGVALGALRGHALREIPPRASQLLWLLGCVVMLALAWQLALG